jgi:hypothetical protein
MMPQRRILRVSTDLTESKPEGVGQRGGQESGDLQVFAVVYAGKNIVLACQFRHKPKQITKDQHIILADAQASRLTAPSCP